MKSAGEDAEELSLRRIEITRSSGKSSKWLTVKFSNLGFLSRCVTGNAEAKIWFSIVGLWGEKKAEDEEEGDVCHIYTGTENTLVIESISIDAFSRYSILLI